MHFVLCVLREFRANQGFLLASAVAYNTLLSLVPMLALILVVLSQVIDPNRLLETMNQYLDLIAPPGQADVLVGQIAVFLENWKLVGVVGLMILLFFSSLAFTVLENAMSVIFFHRVQVHRRHFLVSAILPYCYILLLAIGFLVVSIVSGGLHALDERTITLFNHSWRLEGYYATGIYVLGVLGEALLLTSVYLVMPAGQLALRHAFIGGVTATVLWEITRHLLVWYFSKLSLVNMIYGSFATAIIILVSLEVGAIILLLGAQVIAEYERIDGE
jgi:membrane protein